MKARTFQRGLSSKPTKMKNSENQLIPINKAKDFFITEIGKSILAAKFGAAPAFQICIRDNYLNIYWKGCSVLKFNPLDAKNEYVINDKYKNVQSNKHYISLQLKNEGLDLVDNGWSFQKSIIEPATKGDIPIVTTHTDNEKKAITDYLKNERPVLIDLEIAFSRVRDDQEKEGKVREHVADRVDMAVLEMVGDKVVLKMIEVKLATDPRLRAKAPEKPEIIKQMQHYRKFIDDEKEFILNSYKNVANNYLYLGLTDLLDLRSLSDSTLLFKEFAKAGEIDPQPYLLIIGDRNEMRARNDGANHLDRLCCLFNEEQEPFPQPILWPNKP